MDKGNWPGGCSRSDDNVCYHQMITSVTKTSDNKEFSLSI